MLNVTKLSALLLSVVVVAGCFGGSTERPAADEAMDAGQTATVIALNEEGTAGEAVHKVTFVEALDEIPESYTLEEWETIKEPLPADDGFKWVRIKGEVTNNSKETQSLDSTNVVVRDDAGNEFSVSTDTTIYIEDDKSPIFIDIQPTQTVEWEGYFMVPADAKGLVLVANDLSFLPESEVIVDLGLE